VRAPHRQTVIRESGTSDPCKGFPPKTSKRPRVDEIKNASVEPSCHCTGTTTVVRSTSAMRSRARAMSQDYSLTGPSPGANQHTYPSSLPPARGNPLSNISSKSHCFALRTNLNIDSPIASRSHTHPSHSQTSRLLTSSLSLDFRCSSPPACYPETGRTSATTTAKEASASSATGRASTTTTASEARARTVTGGSICEHTRVRSQCKHCTVH
jgi:hypothetical protein